MQSALKLDMRDPLESISFNRFHTPLKDHNEPSPTLEQLPDGSMRLTMCEDFNLEESGYLPEMTLVYETWGKLNQDKSNAILIHHALSVGSHASSTAQNPKAGWWQNMIGPGKAIDSSKYYVICINNLGSCFGSTGPLSINPETGNPYKYDLPQITIGDMVRSQKLLMEKLKIKTLYAVVGSSMGAMLSLTWAVEYPDSLSNLILISSSYKAYPANIANRNIQHQAIKMDPMWQQGNYKSNQDLSGFKLARKLGLYSYRHSGEWNQRFNSHKNTTANDADIMAYFDYNADKFCNYFDANSYLILTQSMDLFNIIKTFASSKECFSKIMAKTLVVSVDTDTLFTPQQQQELFAVMQEAGVDCSYIHHQSKYGHDAFLVETEAFTNYIGGFLKEDQQEIGAKRSLTQ